MIREASINEWVTVADVTKAAYEQYAALAEPAFWAMYQVATRETLLNDKDIVRLVEVENGEIAASAIYVPPYEKKLGERIVKNTYPEMRLLSVPPSLRNRGLADKLITTCEMRARSEGYTAITLHTTEMMTTAKAMYERRGYTRFSEIDFEPIPDFVVWGYIKRFQDGT